MMRNKLILSILILMFVGTAKSQNLKTFSGEFENGEPFKAKATYTYYEDSKTQAYIKHGSFKYSNIVNRDGAAFNATFFGNFKDNNKDGTWNFSVIETDVPHSDGLYYSGSIKLIANYSNGYPNGTWSYSKQMKRREKKYNGTWSTFENLPNETVNGTFKNGTLTGSLTTINNPIYEEYNNVTGQYDLNGNPIGKWIFKSPAKEKVIEYERGVVKNFVIRDITNGQVVSTDEVDEEMQKIKTDFVKGSLSISDLAKNRIQVDTINMVA